MSTCKVSVAIAAHICLVLCVTTKSAAYDLYYDQKPLLLTPYLKAGQYAQAQNLAKTNVGGRLSYSGYFTTDEKCGNNLFGWFFPAEINWNSAPVLLWLNGGPGSTSMFGLFSEVGPWSYFRNVGLVKNDYTWTKDHNVLFVDQPVGTGFSFTENDCYAKNMTEVTNNLYSLLTQFFKMFKNLQKNKLFITGESFSGHYNIELAVKIHQENQVASNLQINLVGVLIGNSLMDMGCNDDSDLKHELGIVDGNRWLQLRDIQKQIKEAVNIGDYKTALQIDDSKPYNDDIKSYYNVLYDDSVHLEFDFTLFLRQMTTRNMIHTGYTSFFTNSDKVFTYLVMELFKSERPNIEFLLKTGKYNLGFYTGQMDTVVPVTAVTCTLSGLQWAGSEDYINANRTAWRVSGRLAGWITAVGNLLEIVVRSSGHFVPADQGEAALDMIKTFVASNPGNLKLFSQ